MAAAPTLNQEPTFLALLFSRRAVLFALLLFIVANVKSVSLSKRFTCGLGSLVAGGLALLSKETAITLPLVFLLYDICFMRTHSWIPFQNRIYRFYAPLFTICLATMAFSPATIEHLALWWGRCPSPRCSATRPRYVPCPRAAPASRWSTPATAESPRRSSRRGA